MADTKIRISAETGQAEASIRSLGTSILGLRGNIASFAGVMGNPFVAAMAVSVGAFGAFIKSSIDAQDQLDELSSKTGISVKDLAGLKFAADQNGTSLDLVSKAVKELSVNMSAAPDKFAKLGINATSSVGALTQIADIVASMPDGMQKTALLAELLGKKYGPEMAALLNIGGAELDRYIVKGQKVYGATKESAKAAGEFKDQMAELGFRTQGLAINLSNILLPALNDVAKALQGTTGDPLKDLNIELETVRRNMKTAEGGGLLSQWLHGSKADLKKREAEILQSIANTKAEMAKALVDGDKPKTTPKSVIDLLGGNQNQKNGLEALRSLERDYQNELAKRKDALNAPLLSASEKQLAEDLRAVHKRAQDARVALENQKASQGLGAAEYSARLSEVTDKEQAQIAAVKELQTQQDKLNGSWEYGARTAMRKYIDEAQNVAGMTDGLFTNAFKGMEAALAGFVQTGKLDFKSLADSIIADMVRISIRQSITGPLAMAMSSIFGGGLGVSNANGGVYTGAGIGAYSGKVVSSPTVFPFARGVGLMGEAGPEAILPLTRINGKLGVQAQGGGGGGTTVNVYNNSQERATVNETTDDRGNRSIDVAIGDMVSSELARPGSSMHKTMRSSFGVQPAMVRR